MSEPLKPTRTRAAMRPAIHGSARVTSRGTPDFHVGIPDIFHCVARHEHVAHTGTTQGSSHQKQQDDLAKYWRLLADLRQFRNRSDETSLT